MEKNIFVQDESTGKFDVQTGEMLGLLRKRVSVHAEKFFCMYLESWDDFGERDGGLKTVFTWCIIKSSFSKAGEKPEGNFFTITDVIDYVEREHPNKSIPSLRNDISILCKRGFIFKVESSKSTPDNPNYVKGKYMINPKYGIKGSMSEDTYLQYMIDSSVIRKI